MVTIQNADMQLKAENQNVHACHARRLPGKMLIRQLGVGTLQLHNSHVCRASLQMAWSSNRAIPAFVSFRRTRHLHLDDFNMIALLLKELFYVVWAREFPNCDPVF
jgi:hypothetical protein